MSTIERAAELLSTGLREQLKPSLQDGQQSELGLDLIERAAGTIGMAQAPSGPGAPSLHAPRIQPSSQSEVGARFLRVDRNNLRALSLIVPDGERTAVSESFRRVKRQILANAANSKTSANANANLVMVSSALAGEGKTYCAVNLAISMALEVDRTVLLVDADVAKSRVPQALGLQAERGLMELLLDPQVALSDVMWRTDIGALSVLPAGVAHKHATELLASDAMRRLLHEMAERYQDRIIIFDSPPLLAASEATALAGLVGQIVLVVEAGKTSDTTLTAAVGRIDSGKIAGLLLNKIEGPRLTYGYDGYG